MADTNNDSISIEDLFQAFGATISDEPREDKKKSSKKSKPSDNSHDMSELDLLAALGVQDPQGAFQASEDRGDRESSQQRETARKAQQFRSKQWRAEIDELEAKKEQSQKKAHHEPRVRTIRTFPSRVQKTSFSSILPKGAARIIQPMTATAVVENEVETDSEIKQEVAAPATVQDAFGTAEMQPLEDVSNSDDIAQFERVDEISSQDTGPMQSVHSGFMATNFASSSIRPLNDSFASFVPRDSQQFASAAPMQGQPFNMANTPTQQSISGQQGFVGSSAQNQPLSDANANDAGAVQRKPFGGSPLPAFSNASFIQPLEPTMNAFDKPQYVASAQNVIASQQSASFQPISALQTGSTPAIGEPAQGAFAGEKNQIDAAGAMQAGQPAFNGMQSQASLSSVQPMSGIQPSPVQLNYVNPAQADAAAGNMQQTRPFAPFGQNTAAQTPLMNPITQTSQITPMVSGMQPALEQSEPILPPAQAQLDWISSAPEAQIEPIKEDEKSSKRSTIIGMSLIGMAVICAVVAFLLLSGIIDLSNFSSPTSPASSSSSVAREEGPLTEEVVYSYVVRGTAGGTHEAIETAYFGNDGKLKESILQIEVDNQDEAQALLDQLNSEFKDSVKSSTIEDGSILITLDINRDDLDKDSYTELLSTNMAEFKVVSS